MPPQDHDKYCLLTNSHHPTHPIYLNQLIIQKVFEWLGYAFILMFSLLFIVWVKLFEVPNVDKKEHHNTFRQSKYSLGGGAAGLCVRDR